MLGTRVIRKHFTFRLRLALLPTADAEDHVMVLATGSTALD